MKGLFLRQICLVASSKEQAVREFASLLDMPVVHGSGDLGQYGLPGRGPMFEGGHQVLEALGVENLIFGAGTDFVEVLFPTRRDSSTVRLMERRGGDTGYMIILQADDVDTYRQRGDQAGIRVIHQADFPQYRDVHFHPKDTGGALLSVARQLPENVTGGPWYPAGTAWERIRRSSRATGIAAAELQSADPQTLAARWGRLLARPVTRAGEQSQIELDGGVLRFVPATVRRGEAFSGFDLRVTDPDGVRAAAIRQGALWDDSAIRVCGMRVSLVRE